MHCMTLSSLLGPVETAHQLMHRSVVFEEIINTPLVFLYDVYRFEKQFSSTQETHFYPMIVPNSQLSVRNMQQLKKA